MYPHEVRIAIEDLSESAGISWEEAENQIFDEITEDEMIAYNLYTMRSAGVI